MPSSNTHASADIAFVVRRDNLLEFKTVPLEQRALADGEVELSVDRFAFTSNNVTYGALGEMLSYWNFFPTGLDGWGTIPVWGFGTVTRTRHADIAAGERYFGYYPMATRLIVVPNAPTPAGFRDGAAHRQAMSAIYNRYQSTATDPSYRLQDEPFIALYRPLFGTAFFLDDWLAESRFFDAKFMVFSSASSKTAYSTALMLSERKRAGAEIEIIGLTSPGNAAFVKKLGVYDRVVEYGDIGRLPRQRAAFFDMAGNESVRSSVHRHFAADLTQSSIIGRTHWSETGGGGEKLPGAEPTWFIAVTWIQQRTKQLGPSVVQERYAQAWQSLLKLLADPAKGWLEVVEGSGPAAVAKTYRDALEGRMLPAQGHVLSLRNPTT
jgi:hypothetical protein